MFLALTEAFIFMFLIWFAFHQHHIIIHALSSLITEVCGTIVAIDTLMNEQINAPDYYFICSRSFITMNPF